MHSAGWIDTDQANTLEAGFRMAHWRVRPLAGEFSKAQGFSWLPWRAASTKRHVEPKAMRVLLELAARPGEFITKDELIHRAWDGRPVTDDVLTHAVHALRSALGDDARDPRFIETRSNVGYRLLVPVKATSASRQIALPAWGIAAAACLLLMAAAVFLPVDHPQQQPVSPATIAVLPFLHLSETDEEEYLAAAMTESLILNLAQLPGIKVISRTSVMHLARHEGPIADVAHQLGADLLVEGSVQTQDGQVRVVAQLIEPYEDGHLWAQHFDRSMSDLLALQQDVSRAIAVQIGALVAPVAPGGGPLPAADMQDYLQASYLLAQNTVESVGSAVSIFARITNHHPDFAPAHLGVARSLLFLFKSKNRDKPALQHALTSARQFESLAGLSSESQACIGQIRLLADWDFDAAEMHYQAATRLNRSNTTARRRHAWLLVARQDYQRATEQIHQIRLLDPLYYDNAELATLMLFSGQVDASVAEFERLDLAHQLDKGALRTFSTAYLAAGQDELANRTIVRMLEASGRIDSEQARHYATLKAGQLFRRVIEVKPFSSPIVTAGFENLLGNQDAALAALELALSQRDPFIPYLGALPELASLHSSPRFQAILDTIGVQPENMEHLRNTRLMTANFSNPQTDPQENQDP